MEEILESSVNAEPVANVEPQQTEQTTTPTESVNEEVTTSQQEEKPVQDAQTNAMYAEMRRKAQAEAKAETQKAIDAEYSRLYGKEYGIHTKADYDRAIAQQERENQIKAEAERQGVNEDYIRRLKDLEDANLSTLTEKQEYQRQLSLIKEDESLRKDEAFSDYYTEHETEIKKAANDFKVDLTTAMLLSIKDNFKAIKEGTVKKVQQETINNIIKNGNSSPGSVSSGGKLESKSVWNMDDKQFQALKEKALRGEVKEY